jgi:hypothetical protein
MNLDVAGVLVGNLVFLAVGLALLWALRGFEHWNALVRLLGVAYLLGVSAVVLATMFLLIVGVPMRRGGCLVVAAASIVVALVAGRLAGRPLPKGLLRESRREPWRAVGLAAMAAGLISLGGLIVLSPMLGMGEADAWTSWTPKAQAIYWYGEIPADLFRVISGPSYPLFIPVLEALSFHSMADMNTIVVHLQFALLLLGFVGAVVGLLRPSVPRIWIWSPLALLLVTPELTRRSVTAMADYPLAYFFAAGALALALWFERREPWLLVVAGTFLVTVSSIKREGILLAGAVIAAALVATVRERRRWPPLLLVGALIVLSTIPWRIWWTRQQFGGDGPGTSPADWAHQLARIPKAAGLLGGYFLDPGLWNLLVPAALATALLLITFARVWRLPTFFIVTTLLGFSSFVWIFWSVPDLPLTRSGEQPGTRVLASLALLATCMLPLLLDRLAGPTRLAATEEPRGAPDRHRSDTGTEVALGPRLRD